MLPQMIIGVGNRDRRDDGAGIAVTQRLRRLGLPGVAIVETGGDGTAVLEAWRGAASVLLVDAVRSSSPPGTIHRLDALHAPLPACFFGGSTHAFGVAEAVALGRVLGRLPSALIVYGIEGEHFGTGTALSPPVARAVDRLARRIAREMTGSGPPCNPL